MAPLGGRPDFDTISPLEGVLVRRLAACVATEIRLVSFVAGSSVLGSIRALVDSAVSFPPSFNSAIGACFVLLARAVVLGLCFCSHVAHTVCDLFNGLCLKRARGCREERHVRVFRLLYLLIIHRIPTGEIGW